MGGRRREARWWGPGSRVRSVGSPPGGAGGSATQSAAAPTPLAEQAENHTRALPQAPERHATKFNH